MLHKSEQVHNEIEASKIDIYFVNDEGILDNRIDEC